jgi:S-adenosyl methyltransferase
VAGGKPVPAGIDVTKPNIARVYDAFLDGKDNISHVIPGLPYRDRTTAI